MVTVEELFAIDPLLSPEEREIRDTVARFGERRLRPHLADWFEEGTFPAREIAPELGKLGLLGMHLEGYGCAGASATAYGLACQELEAIDSGVRSMVSVQGSLAMAAIHFFGSEEQKQQYLPAMAAGEVIGCFGLTEPDFGSNPGGMRTRARRDGDDWILNGSKMWITNGSVADIAIVWAYADEPGTDKPRVRGFLVTAGTPGFTTREIHRKLSLRASITAALDFDDVRLPADAVLPESRGLSSP
ncbi:acyl-CoA dehydrogenase family protein, partial [Nocardia salmonicida]